MTIFGGEDGSVDEERTDSENSEGECDRSEEESNSEERRLNFTGNQVLPSRAGYRESFLLGLLSSPLPR